MHISTSLVAPVIQLGVHIMRLLPCTTASTHHRVAKSLCKPCSQSHQPSRFHYTKCLLTLHTIPLYEVLVDSTHPRLVWNIYCERRCYSVLSSSFTVEHAGVPRLATLIYAAACGSRHLANLACRRIMIEYTTVSSCTKYIQEVTNDFIRESCFTCRL